MSDEGASKLAALVRASGEPGARLSEQLALPGIREEYERLQQLVSARPPEREASPSGRLRFRIHPLGGDTVDREMAQLIRSLVGRNHPGVVLDPSLRSFAGEVERTRGDRLGRGENVLAAFAARHGNAFDRLIAVTREALAAVEFGRSAHIQ